MTYPSSSPATMTNSNPQPSIKTKAEPEAVQRLWFLVHTKPRQERVACENLCRQGHTVYLPRYRRKLRRNANRFVRESALFPRYLFVHLSSQTDNWAPIRSTRGVTRVVKFGPHFASVPDDFIGVLRSLEDEGGLHDVPQSLIRQGDRVLMDSGPLKGYEAVFLEEKDDHRVVLMLDIVARNTPVTVPKEYLKEEI